MYGFASLDDIQRIVDSTRIVESVFRPEDIPQGATWTPAYNIGFALGKTDSALNKSTLASPSGGTISVWAGGADFASMADTGDNITAYNFFGNISSGKVVFCVLLPMGWIVIAAECA